MMGPVVGWMDYGDLIQRTRVIVTDGDDFGSYRLDFREKKDTDSVGGECWVKLRISRAVKNGDPQLLTA